MLTSRFHNRFVYAALHPKSLCQSSRYILLKFRMRWITILGGKNMSGPAGMIFVDQSIKLRYWEPWELPPTSRP